MLQELLFAGFGMPISALLGVVGYLVGREGQDDLLLKVVGAAFGGGAIFVAVNWAMWFKLDIEFVIIALGGVATGVGAIVSPWRPRLARRLVIAGSLIALVPMGFFIVIFFMNPWGY